MAHRVENAMIEHPPPRIEKTNRNTDTFKWCLHECFAWQKKRDLINFFKATQKPILKT